MARHTRTTATDRGDEADDSTAELGTTGSALAADDLVVGYPETDAPVLDGTSVTLQGGAVTALVGPNGSGKSTLLKALASQLAPERGSILVDGRDVQALDQKAIARRLGLLAQESDSPNSLTVEDLVYHGRYPHRGFFEAVTETDRTAVERAIALAGVDHLRDRELGSLSGGQRQLAWIAMVLAQETDVLLLDEPTTFLDPHHQLEVMEIVETLRRESEITVALVLHDIEQAARYADRVVALRDGEIRARGRPEDVVTEALMAEVFRVEATVEHGAGGPTVTPERPIHDDCLAR